MIMTGDVHFGILERESKKLLMSGCLSDLQSWAKEVEETELPIILRIRARGLIPVEMYGTIKYGIIHIDSYEPNDPYYEWVRRNHDR